MDDRKSEYRSGEKKMSAQEGAVRERAVRDEHQGAAGEGGEQQHEDKAKKEGERVKGDKWKVAATGEKEMEMREGAVKARITTAAGEAEAEEAIAVEKKADRVKTGTPRLDDLLYGGIPFNSNVLFVGPAFVGKEVALLNFIAEGLKKGI